MFSALALEFNRRQSLWTPSEWSTALDIRADRLLLAIGGLACFALLAGRVQRLRPLAAAPVFAALVLLMWRGHSGDDARWWSTPIGTAHVVGGAMWAGALLHLTTATKTVNDQRARGVAAAALRYSRFALISVIVAIAAGTAIAFTRFKAVGQLWSTQYGRLLAVKVILVVVALVIATTARRRGLPAGGDRLRILRRLTRVEVVVVGALLAASAALATTAPPSSASAFALGPPPLANASWSADLAGNNLVLVAAVDHQLQVRVLQPGGQPPPKGRSTIVGHQPDGSKLDISPRSCGSGCEVVNHEWNQRHDGI